MLSPYAILDASGFARCVDLDTFKAALGDDYCTQVVPRSPLERTYTVYRVQDADSLDYLYPFIVYPSEPCTRLLIVRHHDLSLCDSGWTPSNTMRVPHYTSTLLPAFDIEEPEHAQYTIDMDPTDLLWCRTLVDKTGNYGVDVGMDPQRLLHVWMQRKQSRAQVYPCLIDTRNERGLRLLCAPRVDGLLVAASSDLQALAYWLAFNEPRPPFAWETDRYMATRCRTYAISHRHTSQPQTMACVEADGSVRRVAHAQRYIATIGYRCTVVRASSV